MNTPALNGVLGWRLAGVIIRVVVVLLVVNSGRARAAAPATQPMRPTAPDVATLAKEVQDKGQIGFGARTSKGDWDLFTMNPDGSDVRNITNTPNANEGMPRFSPDGKRLLYRRIGRDERFDNNEHGTQGVLVIANRDGTNPQVFGKEGEYAWASWSPDGRQIACLDKGGISIVDLATKKVISTLKRQGFYQQMTWSPDGKGLSGVSNSFGITWVVARMEIATGKANAVSATADSEGSCTPDWFPDARRMIYSSRPAQWTQLWMADADGKGKALVYAEEGRHVYGGCVSPDGNYVIFTGNNQEDGDAGSAGSPMALMRLKDAPIVGGSSEALHKKYPKAKLDPVLTLPSGWEPCWTPPQPTAGDAKDKKQVGSSADPSNLNILTKELHAKGWIAFSAKTEVGDWDLGGSFLGLRAALDLQGY